MTTALTLTTRRGPDGAAVVAAAGEIDMSNAGRFAAALEDARRESAAEPVGVDLTAGEYIDSAGLAALLPHVEHLRLLATGLIAPVLAVVGLDELTTLVESQP